MTKSELLEEIQGCHYVNENNIFEGEFAFKVKVEDGWVPEEI